MENLLESYERCGRVVNTLNKSRTWIMTINANEMPWHGLKASDINWNMTATESNGIITVEGTAGNDCYTPQYGEKTLLISRITPIAAHCR